jgi:hypothetical protein
MLNLYIKSLHNFLFTRGSQFASQDSNISTMHLISGYWGRRNHFENCESLPKVRFLRALSEGSQLLQYPNMIVCARWYQRHRTDCGNVMTRQAQYVQSIYRHYHFNVPP